MRRVGQTARDDRFCDQLTQDQDLFLKWAGEKWPVFLSRIRNWESLWDPIDPADLGDVIRKVHDNRGLVIMPGLGDNVHIEIRTDAVICAQLQDAIDAVYQRMFNEDWVWASDYYGDDFSVSKLPRSRTQRLHDALIEVIRAGYAQIDPGATITTNVVIDERTLLNTCERAEGSHPPQRSSVDAETMRSETTRGARLSPQLALAFAMAGHLRSVKLSSVSLEASRKNRLFQGLQRLLILIRDPHCVGAGCGTRSHECEVDHTEPRSHGGLTSDANGRPMCPPCHRYKTWIETHGLKPPKASA